MAAAKMKEKIGTPVFKEDASKPKLTLVQPDPRYTYDKRGNVLKFDDGKFWYTRKLDSEGRELRLENSKGFWVNTTYDQLGNILTEHTSNGHKLEYTRDAEGRELTLKTKDSFTKYEYDENGMVKKSLRVQI